MFTFQKFYLNACLIITVMKKIILFIIQCFFHQSAQWQIQTFRYGWGGGRGGHPDPEIRGGPGLPPNFFWPFGPHFGQKMGGGGASPLDPPLLQSHHNPLYIKHLLASDRTHWLPVGCEEYEDDDHRHHHGHHLHHHHDTLFY